MARRDRDAALALAIHGLVGQLVGPAVLLTGDVLSGAGVKGRHQPKGLGVEGLQVGVKLVSSES